MFENRPIQFLSVGSLNKHKPQKNYILKNKHLLTELIEKKFGPLKPRPLNLQKSKVQYIKLYYSYNKVITQKPKFLTF